MKKDNPTQNDDLRPEYRPSDFPDGMERGKYAERLKEASNIVVLDPEVAEAFPNEEAVNEALHGLIDLAKRARVRTRTEELAG